MKIRTLIIGIALFGMTTAGATAQDCGYYPFRDGAVMSYQTLDAKGKITGTSRTTLLDVIQSAEGWEYKVKSEAWDEKNTATDPREYTMHCRDGVFTIDMESMLDPKMMEGYKDMELSIEGNAINYPNSLSVGQQLPDANINMKVMSGGMSIMTMSVLMKNRKVVGQEDVTVPAGTFSCYKLTYDIDTKMMFSMTMSATEWLNRGVGIVKSETADKNGKLKSSMVLKEFKP